MNFNFNNQRTKFQLGPPIIRHFSTIGLVALKADQNDYTLKPDYVFKNVQNNFLQNFGGNTITNKSFSNPNFVNKQNPRILTVPNKNKNGSITFDSQKFVENVSPHLFAQQPKHFETSEEKTVVCQTPDKLSSQNIIQNQFVNKSEMTQSTLNDLPVKLPSSSSTTTTTTKKNRTRKNRKTLKMYKKEIISNDFTNKKSKTTCSAPKKFKKEPEMKSKTLKHSRKSKKCKPWHKISLDMEIMECSEPSISTPDTPQSNLSSDTFCMQIKSSPIEIITPTCKNIISEAVSMSISPCADFLRTLSSSNTSSSDVCSISPSSPAIRRLRLPSDCDSEDSFIVFCDGNTSSNHSSIYDDDSASDDSSTDFDEDVSEFDVEEFQEKTDLNKEASKKKVTFRCDSELCKVHPMVQWGYAYHSARIGPWEQLARDRERFEFRIKRTEPTISSILDPLHRERVYHERFEHFT